MNDATSSMIPTRNMKEAWPAFDILISIWRYSTMAGRPPASPFWRKCAFHHGGTEDTETAFVQVLRQQDRL